MDVLSSEGIDLDELALEEAKKRPVTLLNLAESNYKTRRLTSTKTTRDSSSLCNALTGHSSSSSIEKLFPDQVTG
jgi:hypothetical protein